MSPEPKYSPQDVPFIKKGRNRLAGTRMKQLLRAAERAHDDPPPQSGECCGSACDPCVTTLWAEELAVWRERWGEGAVEDAAAAVADSGSGVDKKSEGEGGCAVKMKMPGGWEW